MGVATQEQIATELSITIIWAALGCTDLRRAFAARQRVHSWRSQTCERPNIGTPT
jgi:hypothetical protein